MLPSKFDIHYVAFKVSNKLMNSRGLTHTYYTFKVTEVIWNFEGNLHFIFLQCTLKKNSAVNFLHSFKQGSQYGATYLKLLRFTVECILSRNFQWYFYVRWSRRQEESTEISYTLLHTCTLRQSLRQRECVKFLSMFVVVGTKITKGWQHHSLLPNFLFPPNALQSP